MPLYSPEKSKHLSYSQGEYSVQLLKALLLSVKIPSKIHDRILITIDKLDKLGMDGMKKELKTRGLEDELIDNLISTIEKLKNEKNPLKAIELAKEMLVSYVEIDKVPYDSDVEINSEELKNESEEIFNNLVNIVTSVNGAGIENGKVEFDPFLVRGMAYYTGPIFEISYPGVPFSIAGGGRFDGLIGILTGNEIPACGFSIGFERILYLMKKNKMFPEDLGKIDIFMPLFDDKYYLPALKLANYFRVHNLYVEVFPESIKINKQLKIADKKGVPFVIFVGEDELKKDEINVKNMATGEVKIFKKKALSVQYILDNLKRFQL